MRTMLVVVMLLLAFSAVACQTDLTANQEVQDDGTVNATDDVEAPAGTGMAGRPDVKSGPGSG